MKTPPISPRRHRGPLSRRRFMQGLAASGVVMATQPYLSRPARAGASVSYYTWGRYDRDEFFGPYASAHGTPPSYFTYGDSEEALQRMRAGFEFDVAHPCNTDIPRWKASGQMRTIDTSRLSNFGDLFPSLIDLPGARDDEGQWFVPFDWGNTSITYRPDLVDIDEGDESWGLLWDERYAGRIAIIGSAGDAWWSTAIYAGVDFENVTDEDVDRVNELLRQQRPLVRMYTTDMSSIEQAMASGEVVAAMTWNSTPAALRRQGLPVRFAEPKEGTMTWVCGMMMHNSVDNEELAHDIIDSLISPETGEDLIIEFGYGHSNPNSFERVSEDDLAERGLPADPGELIAAGVFQVPQPQELESRINNDFEEIMAGF